MVLVNIENLSDNELRNIAEQENLEDWENLSREELIEQLEEIYDDEDNEAVQEIHSGSSIRKFVNTLTAVKSDNDLSMPGTEPLPESYNETSIHMVLKDMNWAYVFWSISEQQLAEIEELGATLVLRTIRTPKNGGEQSSYDIDVSLTDRDWTLELPFFGYAYQTFLIRIHGNEETPLCKSNIVKTNKSWFLEHPYTLRDQHYFNKMMDSVILKDGTLCTNKAIQILVAQLDDENAEAEVGR